MAGFYMETNLYTLQSSSGDRSKQIFQRFGQVIARKALQAFLKATLQRIPIRTGFLRGSFRDIQLLANVESIDPNPQKIQEKARKLKERSEALAKKISIRKIKNIKSGSKTGSTKFETIKKQLGVEYYYDGKNKVVKTTTSGIPYATPQKDVLTVQGNLIKIFIDINISYYRVNDFYSRIRGAPWGSLDAGQLAIEQSIASLVKLMLPFSNFMNTSFIIMDGGSVKTGVIEKPLPNITDDASWFS